MIQIAHYTNGGVFLLASQYYFIHLTISHFSEEVNFEELARCTDDFNGAQCKAVCVEAVSHSYLY